MKTFEQFITESIHKDITVEVPQRYDINVDFGDMKNILNESRMFDYLENIITREFGDSVVKLPSIFSGIDVNYLKNIKEIGINGDKKLPAIAVNFKTKTSNKNAVNNNYVVFYIDYEDGKPVFKTDDIVTYGTYVTPAFNSNKYKSELMDALEMNNDLTENVLASNITLAMQLIDDYMK